MGFDIWDTKVISIYICMYVKEIDTYNIVTCIYSEHHIKLFFFLLVELLTCTMYTISFVSCDKPGFS